MARVLVIGALLGAAIAWGGPPSFTSASVPPDPPPPLSPQPVGWNVFAVGLHEASVSLMASYGICGAIRKTVRETPTSVAIEVVQEIKSPWVPCPAGNILGALRVPLGHPLRGRAITGLLQHHGMLGPAKNILPLAGRIPRLIGFAPQDAAHVLALFYLHDHFRSLPGSGGLMRVVAQYPPPNQPVPADRIVSLAVAGR